MIMIQLEIKGFTDRLQHSRVYELFMHQYVDGSYTCFVEECLIFECYLQISVVAIQMLLVYYFLLQLLLILYEVI